MRTLRAKAIVAAAAATVLTASGCGFTGLYGAPLPGGADLGDHPFTMSAYFDDVLDLVPQSSVRVNDVPVGKVTKIELDKWTAKVTFQVNDSVKMSENSTAEIAQTSLLGEKYVSINPPSTAGSKTMLHNGSVIQLDHTRSAAEVEQVLGALSLLLNEGGLRQIRTIGDELVTALKGREPDIKGLLNQANTFVKTLDDQKDKITTALDKVNKLAISVNKQKKVLTDALDTFPAALKVLADERPDFTKLLTKLDDLSDVATGVINDTQSNFVTSLKALEPALVGLRQSGDSLIKSLRIAGTFPFPLGTTRELVKGDYANLTAYLNLDVGETLCQGSADTLGAALCSLLRGDNPPSTGPLGQLPGLGGTSSATGSSAGAKQVAPTLVGPGR